MTHGAGGSKGRGPFQTKALTLESIGGASNLKQEHLLLALLNAERAWAFAMQVKQDHSGGHLQP